MKPTTYHEVEAKRGGKSFKPPSSAVYRGKPCEISNHFRANTLLREMVRRADMLARNDPTGRRFIYETQWRTLRKNYSQSAIDRTERVCEASGILTPTQSLVNGRLLNGWIVIDHDKHREVEDGQCYLRINLNSNPPRRKRGERRWKPQAIVRDGQADARPDSGNNPANSGSDNTPSPFQSPFPQNQSPFHSPFHSPFVSPFQSPFPSDSESISPECNQLSTQHVTEADLAKNRSESYESCQSCQSYESSKEQSCESCEQATPETTPNPLDSFSNSSADSDENQRAREELTVADVLDGADLFRLCDGELDERFPSFANYEHLSELHECVHEVVRESLPDPYVGRETNVRLMRRAMQLLKTKYQFNTPKGWLPVMDKLRANPEVKVCHPVTPPPTLAEAAALKKLLAPPMSPFACWEAHLITEAERDLLIRLADGDYKRHPEFYAVIAAECEQREKEQIAQLRRQQGAEAAV